MKCTSNAQRAALTKPYARPNVGKKFHQRIIHAGSALGGQKCNSPLSKQRLLQRVRRGHEYERARTIILVTRSFPGLPDVMQQQPDVWVRHAVANKQDGAARASARIEYPEGNRRIACSENRSP